MRDEKNELPGDFNLWLNRWALEMIGVLALDTRLGVLDKNISQDSSDIIKYVREVFELIFQLDMMPSIWKYYKTPSFKRLMKVLDELTR